MLHASRCQSEQSMVVVYCIYHCQYCVVSGTELCEIQKQIDHLPVKTDAPSVCQLLALRRDVLFLEFDVAVRHSVGDTFLATGNVLAYKVLHLRTVCGFLSFFLILDFIGAKGGGGGVNNWSYKAYKTPVKMSPPIQ